MNDRRSPPEIKPASEDGSPTLARLIQQAYKDVALRFGLTPENCPKHPSNCTEAWIRSDLERGVAYSILTSGPTVAGCAALETTDPTAAYLMRLAVLPEFRRRGFGEMLVQHNIRQAQRLAMPSISIGLIAEQEELVTWYRKLGFILGETRQFDHLPFTVRYMTYPLLSDATESI